MATVLVMASPKTTDPDAFRPLLSRLVGAGHRVVLLATRLHEGTADAVGATYAELPPMPARPIRRRGTSATAHLRRVARYHFVDPLPGEWRALEAVLAAHPIDLVLGEPLCAGAAAYANLPRTHRPPMVLLGTIPLPFVDPDAPPYGLGSYRDDSLVHRLRNHAMQVLLRRVILRGVTRDLHRGALEVSGHDMRADLHSLGAEADLWLQLTVPRFEYPSTRTGPRIRMIGPLAPFEERPLPAWWDYRDPRPIVHVRAEAATLIDFVAPAIAALAEDDVSVVVTGVDRAELEAALGEALPPNVQAERSVTPSRLFLSTSVSITRAAFVPVQQALRFGVPVIAFGTDADEAETAARLTWARAGVRLRTDRPTAQEIREAVQRVLGDDRKRRAAALICAQAASMSAEAAICAVVEEMTAAGAPVG